MFRLLLLSGLAITLSACLPAGKSAEARMGPPADEAAPAPDLARAVEQVRAFLANTTTRMPHPSGPRIEHLAGDGRSYLWAADRGSILTGQWSVRTSPAGAEICIDRAGQGQTCQSASTYLLGLAEVVTGDPLRLTQGMPFPLPVGGDLTISFAMMKAGFGPLQTPNKAIAPRYPNLG